MNKEKTYNIFLFLSTFTRGLVEVFSLVLLYKKGYSLNNLFYFLFLMYLTGIIINYLSLKLYYKIVLIISSLTYGLSFIYLSLMPKTLISLSILSILLSISNYSYHEIRHFLALTMLENKKRKPSNIILITYIGIISSSILGMYLINKLPLIITSILIFIISIISILPILKQPNINNNKKLTIKNIIIKKDKIIFSILEQFKVIFLELQPLFLYIYINNSIYYVGIFNIITNLASLIIIYFLSNKINKNHFKYYTIILGIILFLKLNIKSGLSLLFIAFLEGLFIKIYENISLDNLYSYDNNIISNYLLTEELIFFTTKTIIIFIFLILNLNFYTIMYLNIIGIILSGFFIKKEITNYYF